MSQDEPVSLLESARQSMVRTMGVPLCIYDFSYFSDNNAMLLLPIASREHRCTFCMLAKRHPEAFRYCVVEEERRSRLADKQHAPILDTCHAGITEVIVPIRSGDLLLGALYCGQAFVENSKSRVIMQNFCKRYGYDETEMLDAARENALPNTERLSALDGQLTLLATFIELAERARSRQQGNKPGTRYHLSSAASAPVNPFLEECISHGGKAGRIAEVIKQKFASDVTAKEVASEVGLGVRELNAVLKKQTSIGFRHFLKRARISAAAYLLRSSDLGIGQVAGVVGYQNQFAFSRAFHEVAGKTPTRFRASQSFANLSFWPDVITQGNAKGKN